LHMVFDVKMVGLVRKARLVAGDTSQTNLRNRSTPVSCLAIVFA
jgi:hypothetical protein